MAYTVELLDVRALDMGSIAENVGLLWPNTATVDGATRAYTLHWCCRL